MSEAFEVSPERDAMRRSVEKKLTLRRIWDIVDETLDKYGLLKPEEMDNGAQR